MTPYEQLEQDGMMDKVQNGEWVAILEVSAQETWEAKVKDSTTGQMLYFRAISNLEELRQVSMTQVNLVKAIVWKKMTQRNLYNEM